MIELMKKRPTRPQHLLSWKAFIQYHLRVNGLKPNQLAVASGLNRSLFYRWLDEKNGDGAQPEVKSVQAVCQALDVDAREGLIAAGYFEPAQLRYGSAFVDIAQFTDLEVLGDLMRRMQRHLPNGDNALTLVLADEIIQNAGSGFEEDVVVMHTVADDGHNHHHNGSNAGAGAGA
jgi:transcriptional regulator with XRE-family HTH domain